MPTSSLVFLVIIGVWAAFLIQFWVRRREHLATVHEVDQFSESMRILERQATGEGVADGAARPARPQTLLKRTATASADVEHSVVMADPIDATAAPARQSRRRGVSQRRRGFAVVTAFAALLVAMPLTIMSVVPLAVALVPVVALVAAIAWVRRGVAAQRAARRAAPRSAQRAGQRAGQRPERAQRRAEAVPATPSMVAEQAVEPLTQQQPVAEQDPVPVREELYDLREVEQAAAQVSAAAEPEPVLLQHLVDDDDIPLTWDPVPVPRPTYTMKSRVTRPAPTAADLVGDADTEYAAYEDGEPVRRVAGA